jgi:DNA-binding MarR family transcriptional regulator
MPLTPQTSPGYLLWRVTLAWQRRVTAALEPFGLTHAQFVLLAVVFYANQQQRQPSQVESAGLAGTEPKMTSQLVRTLEDKGLLSRTVDPTDSRARRLAVTARGGELAPRAMAAVEAVDADFFAVGPVVATLEVLRRLDAQPG